MGFSFKTPHEPEVINGWTISIGNNLYVATKNGIVGIQHKERNKVTLFARTHNNPLPPKK